MLISNPKPPLLNSRALPQRKNKYEETNPLYNPTISPERGMVNLNPLLCKIWIKTAITWYLYKAFCMLISNQKSSPVYILELCQQT